ncbi:MAG: selenocysteine-specific translation elongation factor [Planctomycetota bacterium]
MAGEVNVPGGAADTARHFILGTAGHIDHGKTSLVRALTGVNTDRLPEEQRRGMTIELGFAELSIGDASFGIVDVPGHERFVRTMVAGATGIDIAMLVVAADDSVMPQTVEHVDILRLLGVSHGVVALTKVDLVDRSLVELVAAEVGELLADSPLADAEICPVSSVSGEGLEELRQAILRVARRVRRATSSHPFRMCVDRVFTVAGRGTVVTGSVLRGEVKSGDSLEAFPGGHACRVRDLQAHGVPRMLVERGQRAAVNLSGIEREQLARGTELATPGYLQPSHLIDVRLTYLASMDRPLKPASRVRLELGTSDVLARVVLLDGRTLAPGETGHAQLRLGQAITAVYGQRFILRDENASHTLGGGVVLRPVARRRRADAARQADFQRLESDDSTIRVEEVLHDAGFDPLTDLQMSARSGVESTDLPEIHRRLGAEGRWSPVAGNEVSATPRTIQALAARLTAWLERHHNMHPELPGRQADSVLGWLERVTRRKAVARSLLEQFLADGRVKRLGRFICAKAFAPALTPADEKLLAAMIEEILRGAFQPPALEELSIARQADRKRLARLATLAVALGELVAIDATMYLHASIEQRLRELVGELIRRSGSASVSQIREALGSSRKFVVPFVEYLDRVGFTRRVGDQRVLGVAGLQATVSPPPPARPQENPGEGQDRR